MLPKAQPATRRSFPGCAAPAPCYHTPGGVRQPKEPSPSDQEYYIHQELTRGLELGEWLLRLPQQLHIRIAKIF